MIRYVLQDYVLCLHRTGYVHAPPRLDSPEPGVTSSEDLTNRKVLHTRKGWCGTTDLQRDVIVDELHHEEAGIRCF